VQVQTLSFSIQNNSTHLQTTINAFAFTGVIFNVVGAFLALLSSTLFQTNIDRVDHFHDVVSSYTLDEMHQVIQSRPNRPGSPRDFWVEIMKRIDEEQNGGHSNPEASMPSDLCGRPDIIPPSKFFPEVEAAAQKLNVASSMGDAAGTATLSGILCFLVSVVCLAKATQLPAVWIPATTACLCIIILPVLNSLLALFRFSAFISFFRF
jgi:hypothetical protein